MVREYEYEIPLSDPYSYFFCFEIGSHHDKHLAS
jgi:hypothetical protein